MTIQERIEKLREAKNLVTAILKDMDNEENEDEALEVFRAEAFNEILNAENQLNKAIRRMRQYRSRLPLGVTE